MWSMSKEWISGKFKKIFIERQTHYETLEPTIKQASKLPKDKKREQFLTKMRGIKINQEVNSRLKRINDFYCQSKDWQIPIGLSCPICIQIFSFPITTICGHTFCEYCLDQCLLFSSSCPVCRSNIRGTKFTKCDSLNEITIRFSQRCLPESRKEDYQKSMKLCRQWKNNRGIDLEQLQINNFIDVQDTEQIWCEAKIIEIFTQNDKKSAILVHYQGWNTIYDQIIDLSSSRLAKYRFYTSRKDIPRYRMDDSNPQSMYNYVMTANNTFTMQVVANFVQNLIQEADSEEQQDEANLQLSELNIDQLSISDQIQFENQGSSMDSVLIGQIDTENNPENQLLEQKQ